MFKNINSTPQQTRYSVPLSTEDYDAIFEYTTTLTSPRMIEYILFNETCAFDIEVRNAKDAELCYSLRSHDDTEQERVEIESRISRFISEAKDPEMYH